MSLSLNPYKSIISLRNTLFDSGVLNSKKLPLPVISVGNIATGGSGKTPLVMFLSKYFREKGKLPMILSRGYKSELEGDWGLVSADDGSFSEAVNRYGDEPVLMHEALEDVPIVVGKKRFQSAIKALDFFGDRRRPKPDLAILDDGFQHRQLEINVDLLLWDLAQKTINMIPFGSLREPVSSVSRADALILIDRGVSSSENSLSSAPKHENTFKISLETVFPGLKEGDSVVLVSAIAKPGQFRAQAEKAGLDIKAEYIYRDHFAYKDSDIKDWLSAAEKFDASILTTRKDEVKLRDALHGEERLKVAEQAVKEDKELIDFMNWLENRLVQE
jgi:tetraacyldisaccharide 4'-kinase